MFYFNFKIYLSIHRENHLVKVNGNIRSYEGMKSLMIYGMTIVKDWNQMTNHFLECIATHLKNTRGLPSSVSTIQ